MRSMDILLIPIRYDTSNRMVDVQSREVICRDPCFPEVSSNLTSDGAVVRLYNCCQIIK